MIHRAIDTIILIILSQISCTVGPCLIMLPRVGHYSQMHAFSHISILLFHLFIELDTIWGRLPNDDVLGRINGYAITDRDIYQLKDGQLLGDQVI